MNRVLIARMNADPAHTEEFNRWYDGEHMQQASGIPGYGTDHCRYRSVAIDRPEWSYRPHPEYSAIYQFQPDANLASAINSDQYRAWSGDFLARWRDRTSNEVSVLSEQEAGQEGPVPYQQVVILQINPNGDDEVFRSWFRDTTSGAEVAEFGSDHRLFHSLELQGKYWHYQPNPQFTALFELQPRTDPETLVRSQEFQRWCESAAAQGTSTPDYELLTICQRIY